MAQHFFNSTIPVVNVKDLATARQWYVKLLGEPTVEPEPGTAEWSLGGCWLQVTEAPEHAGHSVVVLGTSDIEAQVKQSNTDGVTVSEIQDFGFIKLAELTDPDGNTLQVVQEVAEATEA